MPKTPKVVPIEEEKNKVIARDTEGKRIIVGIGSQRIAIDLYSRITPLAPHTGDHPANVVQLDSKNSTIRKKKHLRPSR